MADRLGEVARLRAALEPFATFLNASDVKGWDHLPDDHVLLVWGETTVTLGDLRAARAALGAGRGG